MRARALAWLAALALLAGCGETAPPAGLEVVASFYPLYEFTRAVAGERARVSSLVPPGVEPHDWDPSPQDMARVEKARVLVYNGAGLEPWVDKLLPRAKGLVAVKAVEGLPILHANAVTDPHVWLDPVLAQSMVDNIRAGLAAADPAGAAAYETGAQAFKARLAALHQAHEAGLRSCARRDVITSHSAFAYLAQRYGLSVVPLSGVTPESEPSPARLAAIVRFARERKVKYIFFETLVSPRLAETLARELGARTLVFNPIEGVTREQAAAGTDYFTLMEENLRNLRTALECS